MKRTRRSFLKFGMATAAARVIAGFPAIIPRRAFGQVAWGDVPTGILPAGYQPKKVLEIHCFGAPSIWENFWVHGTTAGGAVDPNWRGFDTEMAAAEWLCPSAPDDRPTAEGVKEFAQDSLGNTIFWGPATKPLWPDAIMNRTRMVVQKHDNPAIPIHEAAMPYAITGTRLGTPRHAGIGAAFQHHGDIENPGRTIPHAYVLSPNDIGAFNAFDSAALSTGQHPGGSRPLMVKIGSGSGLQTQLERTDMTAEADSLLDALRGQYRDRLRHHAAMVPTVRSAQFTSYDAAVNTLFNAPSLIGLFSGNVLDLTVTPYCLKQQGDADPADVDNRPATAINLARRLLTDPTDPASYVIIADGGVEKISGQPPYDTHASVVGDAFEHVRGTNANLFNMMLHLSQAIDPTGSDPAKINLDDTMIVINSEFSRTPTQSSGRGREHWNAGYVAIVIGGPVTSRAIVGGIESDPGQSGDGVAPDGHWHNPTDLRGAILLAGGIWPFENELFGVLDFGPRINVGTESGNAQQIVQEILGL